MSRELGLDRRRFCLGLTEEVAAVSLSRKSARQRAPLRPRLGSSGDRRACGVADARGPSEAPRPLVVGSARLLGQRVDGLEAITGGADRAQFAAAGAQFIQARSSSPGSY